MLQRIEVEVVGLVEVRRDFGSSSRAYLGFVWVSILFHRGRHRIWCIRHSRARALESIPYTSGKLHVTCREEPKRTIVP